MPVITATAAHATNQVQCGTRTDYLKITHFNGISNCFAYAGLTVIPPQLRQQVKSISSGNNAITVTYYSTTRGNSSFYLPKWSAWYNSDPTGMFVMSITVH